MRFKKGFTLAEILIVLMVIGVIATLTIPSLMKGVTEAQYKTAYKKAYNAVANIAAMEKIAGSLPTSSGEYTKFWEALNSSLSVKEYGYGNSTNSVNYYSGVEFSNSNGGTTTSGSGSGSNMLSGVSTGDIWIVSDDNLAYKVLQGGGCYTKASINATDSDKSAASAACAVVEVDVNGLTKGPNRLESQVESGIAYAGCGSNAANKLMDTLTGDRYYIYVGMDGAATGAKTNSVSGRIMADLK